MISKPFNVYAPKDAQEIRCTRVIFVSRTNGYGIFRCSFAFAGLRRRHLKPHRYAEHRESTARDLMRTRSVKNITLSVVITPLSRARLDFANQSLRHRHDGSHLLCTEITRSPAKSVIYHFQQSVIMNVHSVYHVCASERSVNTSSTFSIRLCSLVRKCRRLKFACR